MQSTSTSQPIGAAPVVPGAGTRPANTNSNLYVPPPPATGQQ